MSLPVQIENMRQIVQSVAPEFSRLAQIHGAVNFEREASFAIGILKDNQFLAGIAQGHPDSLKRAVINVAAIGLSLNPVHKLAYLLPRDKKIILAVSYIGLLKLATDCGAIKWAHADVVFSGDKFESRGPGVKPIHEFNPFSETRGELVGAYCVAKTTDGEFLTTTMNMLEIESIRDRSDSWKAHKSKGVSTPWQTDKHDMIKKTVIRKAYKTWPMTDHRRFDEAIAVSNEADPIDFNTPALAAPSSDRDVKLSQMREMLSELGRTEDKFIEHAARTFSRQIASLSDLTDQEIQRSIVMLNGFIDQKAQP